MTRRSTGLWRRAAGARPAAAWTSSRRPRGRSWSWPSGGVDATRPDGLVAPAVSAEISSPEATTILIADDDPTIVRLLTLTLAAGGLPAADGQ